MNWFRQVRQRIVKLGKQNTGQRTTYTHREQRVIGTTENFTVYNVINDRLFIKMPRTSMYISIGEAKALRDILSASLK